MYMFKTDTETSSDDTKSVFADGEAVLLSWRCHVVVVCKGNVKYKSRGTDGKVN